MSVERLNVRKMLSWKAPARLIASGSLVLIGFASSAMANIAPYDPHALFATGGDPMPISSMTAIIFSSAGGGIFAFENDTSNALSEIDVDIVVPSALAANGFTVVGTIVPGPGQAASFGAGFVPSSFCTGPNPLGTTFCEKLTFALIPGPIVPVGGHFVLDFNDPIHFTSLDVAVQNGTYSGDSVFGPDQIGSWGSSAQAFVTPIVATPEPRYAGLLAGILALAIYSRRRSNAVAR